MDTDSLVIRLLDLSKTQVMSNVWTTTDQTRRSGQNSHSISAEVAGPPQLQSKIKKLPCFFLQVASFLEKDFIPAI